MGGWAKGTPRKACTRLPKTFASIPLSFPREDKETTTSDPCILSTEGSLTWFAEMTSPWTSFGLSWCSSSAVSFRKKEDSVDSVEVVLSLESWGWRLSIASLEGILSLTFTDSFNTEGLSGKEVSGNKSGGRVSRDRVSSLFSFSSPSFSSLSTLLEWVLNSRASSWSLSTRDTVMKLVFSLKNVVMTSFNSGLTDNKTAVDTRDKTMMMMVIRKTWR